MTETVFCHNRVMDGAKIHHKRVDWVDYAKGFCIVFVVMMHSTLGVEAAVGNDGWLHPLAEFARPFRMPDFFMISGLFLAQVIDRDWRNYLDRKVVHFAYFYLLWVKIQFAVKAPELAAGGAAEMARLDLLALIDPFGTLWFIYLLPIFFVVTKLTRRIPVAAIWLAGAALEIAHIDTGWMVIDEFAARFVYFYTGYIFARHVFAFTARADAALAGARRTRFVGPVQWRDGPCRLCALAVAFARDGPDRRRRGGDVIVVDGVARPIPSAALLRAQLNRHLPRLLFAYGGDPYAADQNRMDRRCRHHIGDCHRRWRCRLAGVVLGSARYLGQIPVRAAGAGFAAPQARGTAAGGIDGVHRPASNALIHRA